MDSVEQKDGDRLLGVFTPNFQKPVPVYRPLGLNQGCLKLLVTFMPNNKMEPLSQISI